MTVGELKKLLENIEDSIEVILVDSYYNGHYIARNANLIDNNKIFLVDDTDRKVKGFLIK